jgi:hypothetical protein
LAGTGISALGDSIFAELVQDRVVQELRPAMTSRSFVRFAAKGPSNVASFPLYGDPGAATAPSDDITDITSTAMSDTQVSATAAEVGLRIDVSDLVRAVAVQNVVADASGMVARSVSEKWETDLAALVDDFTNVTTAGATLTGVDLMAAYSALEQRDIPGPYVGYLDPKQSGELRAEAATTNASYEVGRDGNLVQPFGNEGFFGTYMGLPIYQTSLVVTTSSLVGGGVFNTTDCIGAYEIWGPRIETQRDASLRSLEIVGTMCYGFCEISDTRGQTVKSAA